MKAMSVFGRIFPLLETNTMNIKTGNNLPETSNGGGTVDTF